MITLTQNIPHFLFTVASYDELANSIDQKTLELGCNPFESFFTTCQEQSAALSHRICVATRKTILKLQTSHFANRLQPVPGHIGLWTVTEAVTLSIPKIAICDITMLDISQEIRHILPAKRFQPHLRARKINVHQFKTPSNLVILPLS